ACHLDLEAPHRRREGDAAAGPVRRAGRSCARAAGALLAPRLRAATGDEPTALRPARTGAAGIQLRAHDLVDQVGLHLGGEDLAVERDLLRRLAGDVEERDLDRLTGGGGGGYAP